MCSSRCSAPDPLNVLVLILTKFEALEAHMTTQAEAFAALGTKVDDLVADFRALVEALAAERETLTEAGRAAFDVASAKVDAFDAEVGDNDGSDTPPVEPTE